MTILIVLHLGYYRKLSLTGQWQFLPVPFKLSLTGQWQFWSYYSWVITENCHWPVNDNFDRITVGLSQKIVIDPSMTILIVLQLGYHRKLSLTGQWQFLAVPFKLSLTGQWQFWSFYRWVITENCHWPVNDNFDCITVGLSNCHWLVNDNFDRITVGLSQKIVIDWSMTIITSPF